MIDIKLITNKKKILLMPLCGYLLLYVRLVIAVRLIMLPERILITNIICLCKLHTTNNEY